MNRTGAAAPGTRRSWSSIAYWLIPSLFCLAVYWYGILSWFQADDFAWLSLHHRVHNFRDLVEMLFTPMAQGTVRPLSERGFFLVFYHWFGLNSVPWRVAVYLTQCFNLVLLCVITNRLTQSRAAGFAAAMLWTANSALATAMSWTSDYNQVLCATFLLGALYCWLRFVEGGSKWWFSAQLVVFALGFGALEINVVYPALAGAYVLLLCPRSAWRRLLLTLFPLVLISIVYFGWHSRIAPMLKTGPYALHLDPAILRTFATYLRWTVVPSAWESLGKPRWIATGSLCISTVLGLWLLWKRWPHRRTFLFGIAWFLITLAPVLPLRDHQTDYYLTIPTIGFAIACGAALCWKWKWFAPCALLYVGMMVPVASFGARWYSDRSQHVRTLVLGVMSGREKHPGKPILLDGVNDELYAFAIAHSPFRSLGVMDVYLAPDALEQIHGPGNLVETREFVLPAGPTLRALDEEQLVVYRVDDEALRLGRLRNETSAYTEQARQRLVPSAPLRVDLGNRLDSYLAGPGWYELEVDHRWMGKEATVKIGVPKQNGALLELTGYCPVQQVEGNPLEMTVKVEGKVVGVENFSHPETPFTRQYSVPSSLLNGKNSVSIKVTVNKTFGSSSESRRLGLAFGIIQWNQVTSRVRD